MAQFLKDNYMIFVLSLLIGLLVFLTERVIENSVRLHQLERQFDQISDIVVTNNKVKGE
jgi:hypothetical protein